MPAIDESTFDPNRHLRRLPNGDYLEVKWRLVWLRTVHPDAVIETELVAVTDEHALFRARVSVPGGGSATGYGSEHAGDFRDFIEKAETKALGRALAALGYGTQFCSDFDLNGKLADAPVTAAHRRPAPAQRETAESAPMDLQTATSRQIKFLQAIAREIGLSDADLTSETQRRFGRNPQELARRDASALIDDLQQRKSGAAEVLAS